MIKFWGSGYSSCQAATCSCDIILMFCLMQICFDEAPFRYLQNIAMKPLYLAKASAWAALAIFFLFRKSIATDLIVEILIPSLDSIKMLP